MRLSRRVFSPTPNNKRAVPAYMKATLGVCRGGKLHRRVTTSFPNGRAGNHADELSTTAVDSTSLPRYEWDNRANRISQIITLCATRFVIRRATMDTQKAIELIEKSEHVGVILGPQPTTDAFAAAEVLFRFLGALGKNVGLFASPATTVPSAELFRTVTVARPLPKEFIIIVNTAESPVSQLRYEKQDAALEIVLSPKSSPLRDNLISFKEGAVLCDCAVTLGIPDIEEIQNNYGVGPSFFTDTPLINIDTSSDNKQYGEVNLVDPARSSLAETLYQFISLWPGQSVEEETATLLLAGILDETKALRAGPGADTLLAASELVRQRGSYQKAYALSREPASLELLQLFSRATVRSKLSHKEGVLWSFLTAEDFGKTHRSPHDIESALTHLAGQFATPKIIALLWQSPQENNVRVVLAGERSLLDAVRSRAPGEFRSPHLAIQNSFASFQEAEEYLHALLQEVL